MQWDASSSGGFTSGAAWLPVSPASAAVNVAAQQHDSGSMLSLYRTLLKLRRSTPALRRGSYRAVAGTPKDVFAYIREAAGESWFVALNFGEEPAEIELPDGPRRLRLSTNPDRPVDHQVESLLVLEADEGILVECSAAGS